MTAQSCLKGEASLLLDVVMDGEARVLDGDISADDATYLMAMFPVMKNHILRIFELDEWQRMKLKEAFYGYYAYKENPVAAPTTTGAEYTPHVAA